MTDARHTGTTKYQLVERTHNARGIKLQEVFDLELSFGTGYKITIPQECIDGIKEHYEGLLERK